MAGRIRDEDVALVRERSAIDEVVGEYLQLRRGGGGSLMALCPFHEEKTPSFSVTPSRGLWYCFSCHEGGDVITFVRRIDGLSFAEAVERLAARLGVDLHYEQGGTAPGQGGHRRAGPWCPGWPRRTGRPGGPGPPGRWRPASRHGPRAGQPRHPIRGRTSRPRPRAGQPRRPIRGRQRSSTWTTR